MNKIHKRQWIILAIIGGVLLIFAAPFSDWLSRLSHKPETTAVVLTPQKNSRSLPVLKLKRAVVKSETPAETDTAEEPSPSSLPPRTGTLRNEEIETTIEGRQTLFQRCWTQRLKENPNLSGHLVLQFDIVPRGRIENTQVIESTIADPVMLQCLASVLERISFRPFNGEAITLTFPLSFE